MKGLKVLIIFLFAQLPMLPVCACTTAIVGSKASKSGKPMIWKQRDTDNPSNVLVFIPETDSTLAYTAIFNADDVERNAVYGGQNTSGFAILNNMSYNLASSKYDVRNGMVMRLALETCRTVNDFEAMLANMSPRLCSSNFAVLDSTGACAYIEAADSSLTRFDAPMDGWLVRSNFSLSGSKDGPAGYARYESAYKLMSRHRGKFDPKFLIDGLGRSFYNDVLGYDASSWTRSRYAYDEDFIARPSTSASICIDGNTIWAVIGYTPGAIMIPVKVGPRIPSCIMPSDALDGRCRSNDLASELKLLMHPLPRDARRKYIDFKELRRIRKIVRKYDRKCQELYEKADHSPDALNSIFEQFKNEVIR